MGETGRRNPQAFWSGGDFPVPGLLPQYRKECNCGVEKSVCERKLEHISPDCIAVQPGDSFFINFIKEKGKFSG